MPNDGTPTAEGTTSTPEATERVSNTAHEGATNQPAGEGQQDVSNEREQVQGDDTAPEQKSGQTKAEQEKFIKVRDKEIPYSELSEDERFKYVQLGYASTEKFQEASKVRSQAEQIALQAAQAKQQFEQALKEIKENPIKAAIRLGVDPRQIQELTENFVWEKIQEQEMSPEQRAELERKRQDDEEKRKLREENDGFKKKQNEEKVQKARVEYQRQIIDAASKEGLPNHPLMIKMMAQNLVAAKQSGLGVNFQRAAELVKQDFDGWMQNYVGTLATEIKSAHTAGDKKAILKAGEALEERLGKELIDAVRRYDITRFRSRQPELPSTQRPASTQQAQSDEPSGYMSEDQALEERSKRVAALQAQWDQKAVKTN